MKSRTIALLLVLLLITSMLLVGCGASGATTVTATTAAASSAETKAESQPASTEKIVFKVSHNFTPLQPLHLALEQVAKNVSTRTNGQIELQLYANAEIANGLDGVEQCIRGANFINVYDPSCLASWVPDYNALIGPMLYANTAEFSKMAQTDFAKALNAQAETAGVKILALDYTFGMRNIASNKKPIQSIDDLKGLKIRVPKSQLWIDTFTALGASPAAMSWSEIYNAMETGVVDAFESSVSDMYDSQMTEVIKYMANTGHFIGTAAVMTSKEAFDKLTDEQRQIIEEEFAAGAVLNNQLSTEAENGAVAKMEAEGVVFNDVDLTPFREKAKSVFDNNKTLSPGVYDRIQEELAKIRG